MTADNRNIAIAGTRESWLNRFHESFRLYFFAKTDVPLSDGIRFSCGWPYNSRPSKNQKHSRAIGQTWTKELSKDGSFEIFISPFLDDPLEVAAVVAHELCHVAVGCEQGHGQEFRRVATALGLIGRMTVTTAGEELNEAFKRIVDEVVGPYPHAQLDDSRFNEATFGARKPQKGRLLKVVCSDESCGYSIWTTRIWLAIGTPICPCGSRMSISGITEMKDSPVKEKSEYRSKGENMPRHGDFSLDDLKKISDQELIAMCRCFLDQSIGAENMDDALAKVALCFREARERGIHPHSIVRSERPFSEETFQEREVAKHRQIAEMYLNHIDEDPYLDTAFIAMIRKHLSEQEDPLMAMFLPLLISLRDAKL